MLSMIAAVAKNRAIGKGNQLPWHLPNDLRRFRQITTGHTIIMGRKTFESLPGILPDRHHIVITRNQSFKPEDDRVTVVHSVDELLGLINKEEEAFVIGGAEVYSQLLPYAEKLYLTAVDREFEADAFFPELDSSQWTVVEEVEGIVDEKNPIPHRFITLQRVRQK